MMCLRRGRSTPHTLGSAASERNDADIVVVLVVLYPKWNPQLPRAAHYVVHTSRVARSMKLRTQLLLLQLAIVLVAVLGTGFVAGWLQEQQLRDAYRLSLI